MNKNLFLSISLAVFFLIPFASQANGTVMDESALEEKKVELGGQARFRYEFKNNTNLSSTNDTRDYILTRMRANFKYTPVDELEIFFQPQFSGGFGENAVALGAAGTGSTSTNAAAAGAFSGGVNDATLGVHQGYLNYSPNDWFNLKVGRQELSYGDQMVLSPLGWHNTGRSFDAITLGFDLPNNRSELDIIASFLNDAESANGRGAAGVAGDAYLAGLYNTNDFGTYFKEVDLYGLYRFDSTTRPRPHNYAILGTRLKSKPNNWDYRFELIGQIGKMTGANQRDYAADLEVGYTWNNDYQFRLALQANMASKHFNAMFPLAHGYLGYMDLFGRRNISSGVLRLSMKPADKWKLKLDAHTFMRTTTTAGLSNITQSQGGQVAAAATSFAAGTSSSRLAGEEIDFVVSYKALKYLTFAGGASVFIPMGYIKNSGATPATDKMATYGWLQALANF